MNKHLKFVQSFKIREIHEFFENLLNSYVRIDEL